MTYDDARRYWIWLSSVPGMSRHAFDSLIKEYGQAEYVWKQLIVAKRMLSEKAFAHLKEARTDEYMEHLFDSMEKEHIVAITQMDDDYPSRLRTIQDPPYTLYVRGNLCLNEEKMFAVVGSRKITRDGAHFTHTVARSLAESGVVIVSGLARGADGCAHEGCLEGGGRTIAVLASGPEIIYPPEHKQLSERILEAGGALVSEYPPGTPPEARNFPQRNRIISGMSEGVLMTEGSLRSGAMITVRYARAQGRVCFAVPGSVYSTASEGPNQMLVDGDLPALSSAQILSYFEWALEPTLGMPTPKRPKLDPTSQKIVNMLKFEEKSFDELANDMQIDSSSLNSLLTILEMQGIIRQSAGKLYRAIV